MVFWGGRFPPKWTKTNRPEVLLTLLYYGFIKCWLTACSVSSAVRFNTDSAGSCRQMKFQCQSSNDNGHAHIHCFLFGSWQWSHFLFSLTKLFLESWDQRQSASALWARLTKTLHENISYKNLSISWHQPCASKDWFCSDLFSIAFPKLMLTIIPIFFSVGWNY